MTKKNGEPAGVGHNSGGTDDDLGLDLPPVTSKTALKRVLKDLVARIEDLESEKAQTSKAIKDVYAEARLRGLDTKAIRAIVTRRRKDAAALEEYEMTLDNYMLALGMIKP